MRECIRQTLPLGTASCIDVLQDGILAQIVSDDARHVGVYGLVVGNTGADCVGDGNGSAAPRIDQAAYAQLAVRAEGVGVQEIVVEAAIDRVDRRESGG